MKKLSVIVSLSLMLSCLSWAEKYEYVRLKAKGIGGETFNYMSSTLYIYDSVTLESGDVARAVGFPNSYIAYLYFDDGEDICKFDMGWTSGGAIIQTLVGPGTIYLAHGSSSLTSANVVNLAIKRASDSGSTTLAWNGTEWEGSSDGSQQANNNSSPVPDPSGIKYDSLLGWAYFTDTPWVYSYTNGSWYYMHSLPDGIYVWNANLPNNGWMKLHG